MAISLGESVHIGFADIWTRKVRSIVTIVGIILGVMSIMVVLAIVNGMNKSTMDWMNARGGLNKIEVERNWQYDFSKGGKAEFTLKEIDYIKTQIPEAEAFNPKVSEWGLELAKGELTFQAQVQGVVPDMTIVDEWDVAQGRFIKDLDIQQYNDVIVLGSRVATTLFGSRNPLGKQIMLKGQISAGGLGNAREMQTLKTQTFTVVGVMDEKKMKAQGGQSAFGDNPLEYMNRRAFIPLSTMLYKVNPALAVTSLELRAKNPESAVDLRQKIENIVLNLKSGKRLFQVVSAQEQMQQMKQSSMIFTAVFILIAVISLLVGGIVIMNIMLASIKERTREIGVRLAIGARRRDIFLQFLVQTVMITGLGGIFGIVLGYSILDVVGGYLDIEVAASVQMIWVALMVSVGVGLIFGIMPAVRASNLDPVIALREE